MKAVEAQHRGDLAGAKPRQQAFEAGSLRHAAARAPEIVVDDLDVLKATTAGLLDKVVLTPLALRLTCTCVCEDCRT
ncbi:MAG: hypothetical protein R3F18_03905 [Lysobacterales bacterium]